MTIKDYQDGKLIRLSKPFDTRAKILNSIYFGAFSFAAILFIRMVLLDPITDVSLLFIFGIGGLYLFIGYKFLNKSIKTEEIIINKQILKIRKKGFLNIHETDYDISKISKFRHLSKPEVSKHPLAGESFDYLGFQTEQQVINELHGDNRLGFDYEGKIVTFGEDIYTWDFEQLEVLLYDITGNDFRYDDEYEKTFKQV